MRIVFLAALLCFSGCQFFYQPSYVLGKKIDKETLSVPRTKTEVKSFFGSLDLPCLNPQNVCYLYADIKEMKIKECDLVEFVFDEQENLEYVLYHSLHS